MTDRPDLSLSKLEAVLAALPHTVDLWWRDDDAVAPTPALDQLLALARRVSVPVLLAVIPEHAEPSLAPRLADEPLVSVAVHGIAHHNRAGPGEKKQELGLHRPVPETLAALTLARVRLADMFGNRFLPILVPPWNRIDPAVAAFLAVAGFQGLSADGVGRIATLPSDVNQVNTRIDVIDWQNGRRVKPKAALAGEIADLLVNWRLGDAPIGLLTHHLDHDEADFTALSAIFGMLTASSKIRFLAPAAVFDLAQIGQGA